MQKRNYIMFVLMAVFSVIITVSGFVLRLALPSGNGYRGGRELLVENTEFLGLEKHDWTNLHFVISVALLVTVVMHIVLHRRWIAYMTRKLLRSRKG